MRGLSDLQALRRAGYAPQLVCLDADPGVPYMGGERDPAHLVAEAADAPPRLDLRCLVGLTVAVSSINRHRLEAYSVACKAAGAARVITTQHHYTHCNGEPHFAPVAVTDTEGALAWQA